MKIQHFFGDAKTCTVDRYSQEFREFCTTLASHNNLQNITVLNQTHSSNGLCIAQPITPLSLYETDGDYLITNQKNIGIGILTGDCLPVILHDQKNGVTAAVHAGWRGSVQGIVKKVVEKMTHTYNTNTADLHVLFGPSAQICCYEVQNDFINQIPETSFHNHIIVERDNKLFFDNSRYNQLLLQSLGISPDNIDTTNNICTICNTMFHSYRRDKEKALRQLSLTWIS